MNYQQSHNGTGDIIAGNKIINFYLDNHIFIFLTIFFFIITIVIIEDCSIEKFECDNQRCETCKTCYNLGCFTETLKCYHNQSHKSNFDTTRIEVSQNIIAGDKHITEGKIKLALNFYNKAISLDKDVFPFREDIIGICNNFINAKNLELNGRYKDAIDLLESINHSDSQVKGVIRNKIENLKIKKREADKNISIWEGVWNQQKSGKNGEITGELIFKFSNAKEGEYTNVYANGIVHHGLLKELHITNENISGIWINLESNKKGKFNLKLYNKTSFKGKYSLSLNQSLKYYWNGQK